MSYYRWQAQTLLLSCHLQPRASKDEFCGQHGDSLKIRITAPPVDGKANAHLIKFLAKRFGVSRGAGSIISGELGRQKQISIDRLGRLPEALDIERD
ncbi:MAG: DUF167 family protein [Marinobacterium sp.]|nr:DUF167 family protein [Marinobacterium sp.]